MMKVVRKMESIPLLLFLKLYSLKIRGKHLVLIDKRFLRLSLHSQMKEEDKELL